MSYTHILSRLINTPLLITEDKLNILTSEISLKLLSNIAIDSSVPTPINEKPVIDNRIGIIKVYGSMVNKNGAGMSGSTSYENIRSDINSLIKEKVNTIIFDISTPGGEASGIWSLAEYINKLPLVNKINTIAFTDSSATSGGYILAAACKKIYVTDIADVASIGAVMTLVDMSEADKQDGIKYTILRSKEDKAAYNPHEEMSNKVKQTMLDKLMVIDNKFNETILKFRPNLSLNTLTNLKGNSISGQEAYALGLVDKIVSSIEDVITEVVTPTNVVQSTKKEVISMQLEDKYTELLAQYETLKASSSIDVAKAVKEERMRVQKVIEAGKTFNVSEQTVSNAISKGYSLDMVSDIFSDIAEARGASTAIITTTSSIGSADTNMKEELGKLAATQAEIEENVLGNGLFSMKDLVNAMSELGEQANG